ncbi:MotA/TolQ/ExbB proton channel family protein [Pulveribacter suum]|uniref:Biopolymer transport protein ExbB n=1 Tax=Pulveribacter suum TaxID=2116657 RepID=A0A2P1NI95_9BURK|nr:MotA/TolQ/ExbB proton channel family protein [Pulveribacter suum]AVP56767.1 flagellar motor protein MotA [Pulveribacter suum]
MNGLQWLRQGDAVTQATAALLLAMSVASWVAIFWKLYLTARARADVPRAAAAFWQAGALDEAPARVAPFDRAALVLPLVQAAARTVDPAARNAALAGQGGLEQRLTRSLRGALHGVLARLQWGQVLLATVGSTAPFVGLLGTVWGIHHALAALAGNQQITIERLAGPVGEALVMTAAGLAVAIPAVLAYNWFGRSIATVEAELEGFARDLRALLLDGGAGAD